MRPKTLAFVEQREAKRVAVKFQRNTLINKCRTHRARKASLDGFRRLLKLSGNDWGKVVTELVNLQRLNDKWEEFLEGC